MFSGPTHSIEKAEVRVPDNPAFPTTTTSPNTRPVSLLDLPLEIRLQIYSWVHLLHPFQYRELAPGYPAPAVQPYRTAHLPPRPFAYMPTALLLASRQIYHEARGIPYAANEFSFCPIFCSGLAAAAALVGRAAPWQRRSLRYLTLRMGLADALRMLRREWCALTAGLEGARGLRPSLRQQLPKPRFPSHILPMPEMPVFSFAAVEFVAKLTVACAVVGLVRWLVCPPPRDGRVPVALVGARTLVLLTIGVWQLDLGVEVYEQHGPEALPV
ncbi:unnamed protein product [Parascedosporium putredinis]|uniref:Uncharacterized protein n=1 Tax=Parascedosporium putredinis TaxID=1442378 RepID=A0A9P1MET1_9PEZI|nr:unnamed protein product [Parascedosporium putredinis]CAI8003440.1 unnamed protein product [Parascedosporium putredinis]